MSYFQFFILSVIFAVNICQLHGVPVPQDSDKVIFDEKKDTSNNDESLDDLLEPGEVDIIPKIGGVNLTNEDKTVKARRKRGNNFQPWRADHDIHHLEREPERGYKEDEEPLPVKPVETKNKESFKPWRADHDINDLQREPERAYKEDKEPLPVKPVETHPKNTESFKPWRADHDFRDIEKEPWRAYEEDKKIWALNYHPKTNSKPWRADHDFTAFKDEHTRSVRSAEFQSEVRVEKAILQPWKAWKQEDIYVPLKTERMEK